MPQESPIQKRKSEHLALCRDAAVEFQRKRAWFDCVEFVHVAVPTFSVEDVDTEVEFLDRRLAVPFLIGAMTGGTDEAAGINRALARAAARAGVGLALGSQRPMMQFPSLEAGYKLRDIAPALLILGNVGLGQAVAMKPAEVAALADRIGADGICLHLNAAMELFQSGGDHPRAGAHAALGRLARELGDRLIVKETGCGISRETAALLARLGVRTVDVAGAGGTSWVRVENLRRGAAPPGFDEFEEWGIPTAASLAEVRGIKLRVIASGGLRTGLDLAKSIALGATLGSAALPVLRALARGGEAGVGDWLDGVARGLRMAMVLTGSRDLKALRRAPLVVTGPLRDWMEQRSLWRPSRA
jgi:isopentenyl-diphosphate delta-isomerase